MSEITGQTRLYAIMGEPVAQVRAPMVFNRLFAEAGLDARMVAFQVGPADLAAALDGFHRLANLDGLIVTVPHKIAILPLLAELAPMAARSGAVNLIKRRAEGGWIGEMVDGLGFAEGLRTAGHDVADQHVLLVGAGGAGAAIAFALAEHRCGEITVFDVDPARAEALVARLRTDGRPARVAASSDPAGFPIAINATPLGMRPDDPLPFDVTRVDPEALVAEVIMKPRETRLLTLARAQGNPVVLGERMLDYQAPFVLDFFAIPRP
ncbi:shikimate dehydrogenase [Aliidongia dinghuensis]|uniref:shikimate dehydrogenase (NADP(+)) n=1 Tax=Aliidongia dinghuensis TaxID=1867774 RepID=A0A8J3E1W7_9PROT|nr:shikimate dehydrogenase [Aliidongia dinghuensis]GGF15865.1 shikimate dehydrogenase [Aliidongia dinghuensis]